MLDFEGLREDLRFSVDNFGAREGKVTHSKINNLHTLRSTFGLV